MVKRWQLILGLGVLIGAGITYVALQGAQLRKSARWSPLPRKSARR